MVNFKKVPPELTSIPAWVGFEIKDGKKTPISLIDFEKCGATDLARLVDFETAVSALEEGKISAIGVSLINQDIVCIDIDCHVPEKKPKFAELNRAILDVVPSYAETSISGCGTHIYVKGRKPDGYKHCDRFGIVEVYNCAHFIIVTGDVIPGHDMEITSCQEILNSLCERHLIKQTADQGKAPKGLYHKTDDEILAKLKHFKNGMLLWEGKWQQVERWDDLLGMNISAFPSQSEGDFSFMCLLHYLNGNNPEQAIKIFMQSGLWTEQRKRKKSSGYVQHMAAEASLRCTKVYDWDRYSYTDVEQKLDFDEVLQTCRVNQLVTQAKTGSLALTASKPLNTYLCKYIANYGSEQREVISTTCGDYDSASNGIRFWLINQHDLIYLSDGDEWLVWNGEFWERCYDKHLLDKAEKVFYQLKHEAYNLFQQVVLRPDLQQLLEEQALQIFEYAATKKNKRECMEMIEFSKQHFIKGQKERGILDAVKANRNVLNLKNGVFDFDRMAIFPHGREFYQTKIAGVKYEEGAVCPLWTGMLETVLPNESVRRFLQKAIGYTASSAYMEKCIFIMYGEGGNNGKTTIARTIHELLGDYGVVAEKQTIMDTRGHNAGAPRPDLVRLRDRRYVCISESEKDDRLAEGLVKNLTGGGVISCRTLHHEPVEFPAIFKIWLDTNYPPQVRGTDQALFRRLRIIPFDVTLPADKVDPDFFEKLRGEFPGILNWVVEGYRLYKEEGFEMPDTMKDLVTDYAEDMSPLDQWVKECVEIRKTPFTHCCTSKVLYQSYYSWCKFNKEYALGQRRFTQEINQKDGFKQTKKVKGYTQYVNAGLNDVGTMFAVGYSDDLDFAKEYNLLVAKKISSDK